MNACAYLTRVSLSLKLFMLCMLLYGLYSLLDVLDKLIFCNDGTHCNGTFFLSSQSLSVHALLLLKSVIHYYRLSPINKRKCINFSGHHDRCNEYIFFCIILYQYFTFSDRCSTYCKTCVSFWTKSDTSLSNIIACPFIDKVIIVQDSL